MPRQAKAMDTIRSKAARFLGALLPDWSDPAAPQSRGGGWRRPPKPLSLALQGGGSHGAFTWGVLDRLLEEEALAFTAVSGASAGAMNAVVLANGLLEGGRDGARSGLSDFWRRVSEAGVLSSVGKTLLSWTPGGIALQMLARSASPHQLNPLDLNPLRDLLEETVDFDRLRANRRINLLVSATNVHTGSPRVFRTRELSSDVLLASACLPQIHRAVEIDGCYYWDGGFTANPAILPLVEHSRARDIVVVHIDTQGRQDVPTASSDISNHLQRILANAPLVREIQTIGDLSALVDRSSDLGRRLRALSLHHILPPPAMLRHESESKLRTDWTFLTELRDMGRCAAAEWLEESFARIGTGKAPSFETALMAPRGDGHAFGFGQG